MPEPVSVIMPINNWVDRTPDAIASILDQSHRDLELLLITNGQQPSLSDRAHAIERSDSRVRVFHRPDPGLPGALNLGIEQAAHELIARMDADDLSHPERLAEQAVFLHSHPELAGCATATQMKNHDGSEDHIHTPPSTPEQSRWRVLVWNPFVHGSMMLRRQALNAVGGYNETLDRAQDLDLWLRLADRGLGGMDSVLYTHFMNSDASKHGLDSRQAPHTARLLLDAWERLPAGDPDLIEPTLSRLMGGEASARINLELHMETHGPTRAALTAWLWSCWRCPIATTDHTNRQRVLESARAQLGGSVCEGVWLWGAGDYARFILAQQDPFGVPIVGVLDDIRAGDHLGPFVAVDPFDSPIDPARNEAVFIASDLYARQIWDRSEPLRLRGVRVLWPSVDPMPERVE